MELRHLIFALIVHFCSSTVIRVSSDYVVGTLETTFLQGDSNSVISPYSIASTLLPLKLGSDGKTRLELEKALENFDFENEQNSKSVMSSISSTTLLFSSKEVELLPEFKTALTEVNVESIENFDFRKYQLINDYVRNATGGLIQEIVAEQTLSKDTKLVIFNGVHFESAWRTPFQSVLRNMPFTLLSGDVTEIPMMYQKSSNYYAKVNELQATVIDLAYKSLDKVLRIYLPFTTSSLPELLKRIPNFNTSSIRMKLSELEVYLPRFSIESQVRLTDGLDQLGLKTLTKSTADFRKISKKPLRVDEIISKAVIEVTQTGTKAGSATAAFIIPLSGFTADEFVANRPFYFEIRGVNSRNVYFSGTLTTPERGPNPIIEAIAVLPVETDITNRGNIDKVQVQIPKPVETPWWIYTGRPEYLLVQKPKPEESTPRFQQPEPFYPSGIRFLYPSLVLDLNSRLVIESHIKNMSSINAV